MNQDRSQEESKPPFAQLGEFSKLPPELRFQIWNCLFDNFFQNMDLAPRALSILSCNRSLNEETSRVLYEHRVLTLTVAVRCSYEGTLEFNAIVKAAKGTRKLKGVKYKEFNRLDYVLRLIQEFPSWRFQKCGPWIHVDHFFWLPPSQELELWECVHRIVDIVKLIPNGKNITFNTFHPTALPKKQPLKLTQSGVIKDWFNERFPGQPLPFRTCYRPDIHDHDYSPGPCLVIPTYHYSVLQAIHSVELKQHERNMLEAER
ncbi:uncharacterized protein N7511_008580 [Penicillium nucicola]|uniref:uncharacterized protein n=1 Tax=Penicillium nucicola TaxID=1850975 RepID=UPI002545AB05|nr:uncharacterized protein N7511_008580 [Penicillium nucicola]KAJ5746884.1 hypothetical protein N7511_008580 [Penicillium nucicola]